MTPAEIEEFGAKWPSKHPKSGEPFVRGVAGLESSTGVTQMAPPAPPERQVATAWEPDGRPTAFRTLTDEEYAASVTAYRNARIAYGTTGGTAAIKRAGTVLEGRFETDEGDWAVGSFVDGQWVWQDWSGRNEP